MYRFKPIFKTIWFSLLVGRLLQKEVNGTCMGWCSWGTRWTVILQLVGPHFTPSGRLAYQKTSLVLCDLELSCEKSNCFSRIQWRLKIIDINAQHNTYLDRNLKLFQTGILWERGCLEGHLNSLYPNHGRSVLPHQS